jgi:uncharacterized OB-fold protein
MAQKCARCGELRWPPQGICPNCYSFESTWEELATTGTVESYVVVHQATVKVFSDDVPYNIVRVLLDGTDGKVVMTSSLMDVPWEEVKVGLRVEAVFADVTPEVTLPRFRLM